MLPRRCCPHTSRSPALVEDGVPHDWILDQVDRTPTVHRHTPEGHLVALRAAADERVRAEPFDAIELQVGVLLGDDPDEAM